MCGIFALLLNNENKKLDTDFVAKTFEKGKNRGPEVSNLIDCLDNNLLTFGFHRLAINGLNETSNQPLIIGGVKLICNGEIYNYKQLYKSINVTNVTDSDCEIIIHLYLKYGIEQTLTMLDGVFAFVLFDSAKNIIHIARDPYGVRPLYAVYSIQFMLFASELKMVAPFYNANYINRITQFSPGTYSTYQLKNLKKNEWTHIDSNVKYIIPAFPKTTIVTNLYEFINEIQTNIYKEIKTAVIKRCQTTERPVACLLSGGLDSSLIAALVAEYFDSIGQQIETYSVGLENSEDIKWAKIVATHIKSKHTEVILTEKDMFDAIPEVIKAIESYDTTTVRASIGNYLVGKYIAKHSHAKVIFNGDGSDELFGGYLYMNKCPDDVEFDKETRRLLKDIHYFDVLRSDKSISSNGLEPRTPFLDRNVVNTVLSIPPYFRNHNNFGKPEKYLLRESFENTTLLPKEVLWRKKEAFSDGVTSNQRSLFTILQEQIAQHYNVTEISIELEKRYYKEIFEREFPHCYNRCIVPYFWMPQYTNAKDPSARLLN